MKHTRKILSLLLALTMVCSLSLVSATAETATELPRNETLYFAGQQWGSVNGWNPLSDDMNNALGRHAGRRRLAHRHV